MSGDFDAVWNAPLLSGVVDSLLHCLPPANPEVRLKQVLQFFTSKHFEEMPYLWLSARIYAVLKDMVKHGAYKKREKAKERLSGFFQDVKHVSTYAPYCDAFFKDKAMAHIVADPRINLEARFGVKVFSLNNWDEFLRWLNDLQRGCQLNTGRHWRTPTPPIMRLRKRSYTVRSSTTIPPLTPCDAQISVRTGRQNRPRNPAPITYWFRREPPSRDIMVHVREMNRELTVWWPDKEQPVAKLRVHWRGPIPPSTGPASR